MKYENRLDIILVSTFRTTYQLLEAQIEFISERIKRRHYDRLNKESENEILPLTNMDRVYKDFNKEKRDSYSLNALDFLGSDQITVLLFVLSRFPS